LREEMDYQECIPISIMIKHYASLISIVEEE
jgi:hypothetical protein